MALLHTAEAYQLEKRCAEEIGIVKREIDNFALTIGNYALSKAFVLSLAD